MKQAVRKLFGRSKAGATAATSFHQDFTPQHWAMIEYARPYTMTSPERIAYLMASVQAAERQLHFLRTQSEFLKTQSGGNLP